MITDDVVDEFIDADAGDSTGCADTNVSDDDVDGLMILMGLFLLRLMVWLMVIEWMLVEHMCCLLSVL